MKTGWKEGGGDKFTQALIDCSISDVMLVRIDPAATRREQVLGVVHIIASHCLEPRGTSDIRFGVVWQVDVRPCD